MHRMTLIALGLIGFAACANAVPGGKLQTLRLGQWTCEAPGDAVFLPIAKPALSFTTIADSSYLAPDGVRGSYLRLANKVTLTSGPFSGRRFVLDGEEIMREQAHGTDKSVIRCVHGSPLAIAADD